MSATVSREKYLVNVGDVFGRWTVIDASVPKPVNSRTTFARCRCECGTVKDVSKRMLHNGGSRSCGCLARELSAKRKLKHGGAYTLEYEIWRGVLKRCNNPSYVAYPNYGGRGIRVCDRWLSFDNFISDMGVRPHAGLSIERRDNNGDYCPENCYWATSIEQNNNTRGCRPIEFNGRAETTSQWAREYGLSQRTVRARLKNGWSVEDALTIPVGSIENHRGGGYKLLKEACV